MQNESAENVQFIQSQGIGIVALKPPPLHNPMSYCIALDLILVWALSNSLTKYDGPYVLYEIVIALYRKSFLIRILAFGQVAVEPLYPLMLKLLLDICICGRVSKFWDSLDLIKPLQTYFNIFFDSSFSFVNLFIDLFHSN